MFDYSIIPLWKISYVNWKNSELAKLVAYYEECFRLNQHRQFGQLSAYPKDFLNTSKAASIQTAIRATRHCRKTFVWAHARRKFHEAVEAAPPEEKTNSVSQKGLDFCSRLFERDREYEHLTPEERHKKSAEQSKPVSEAFFTWAFSVCALPKSALGKALHYALEQRPYLETFYLDGRLEVSNNRAEHSIQPFAIGRKNWLF